MSKIKNFSAIFEWIFRGKVVTISINIIQEKDPMNESQTETTPESSDDSPEMIRRDFLKKFGKYAAATPVVTYTLMSSKTSKAVDSNGR